MKQAYAIYPNYESSDFWTAFYDWCEQDLQYRRIQDAWIEFSTTEDEEDEHWTALAKEIEKLGVRIWWWNKEKDQFYDKNGVMWDSTLEDKDPKVFIYSGW